MKTEYPFHRFSVRESATSCEIESTIVAGNLISEGVTEAVSVEPFGIESRWGPSDFDQPGRSLWLLLGPATCVEMRVPPEHINHIPALVTAVKRGTTQQTRNVYQVTEEGHRFVIERFESVSNIRTFERINRMGE